jgi:hypothetical protein
VDLLIERLKRVEEIKAAYPDNKRCSRVEESRNEEKAGATIARTLKGSVGDFR